LRLCIIECFLCGKEFEALAANMDLEPQYVDAPKVTLGIPTLAAPSTLAASERRSNFVREVTHAVVEEIDAQTSGQLLSAWSLGSAIMRDVSQAQSDGVTGIQRELSQHLASAQKLHRETRCLRERLDAVLRNVALVSSMVAAKPSMTTGQMRQIAEESSEDPEIVVSIPTPKTSPRDLDATSSCSSASTRLVETPSTTSSSSFNLTLRRVDDEPFGLEVQPDFIQQCLAVEGIRKGSVCEAWNRQNIGELREIKIGDRIAAVNGHDQVEAMRNEFHERLTVRLIMER